MQLSNLSKNVYGSAALTSFIQEVNNFVFHPVIFDSRESC